MAPQYPAAGIRLADETFEDYLLNGEFTFRVSGYAQVDAARPVAEWHIDAVTPFRKDYGIDSEEFCARRESSGYEVWVAWLDQVPVGHLVLSAHWNGFAQIDELAVDAPARRQGIAWALLDHACAWGRERHLAGLRLETQNNNLAACQLYERYGFVVGGTDGLLYRGIERDTRESAIFWYLIFTG